MFKVILLLIYIIILAFNVRNIISRKHVTVDQTGGSQKPSGSLKTNGTGDLSVRLQDEPSGSGRNGGGLVRGPSNTPVKKSKADPLDVTHMYLYDSSEDD